MFKKILLVLVLLIAALAVFIALQPSHYTVQRKATISAPPGVVFAQVNDLHKWEAWSPWAKMDPAMKTTYSGSPAGAGAVNAWVGNKEVGEGSMTITESHPNQSIKIRLDFIKPFTSTCDVEFTFAPQADQTLVTWTMSGDKNFMSKAFCLFADMDKMVGGDFEKGLAQMKTVSEAAAKK